MQGEQYGQLELGHRPYPLVSKDRAPGQADLLDPVSGDGKARRDTTDRQGEAARANIAIVGAGIAGLTAARLLHAENDITVFEAEHRVGGHANTVEVATPSGEWAIDTGFITLNDRNYPHFTALLENLGVATQPTHMGFSVSADIDDFEYAGTPAGIAAQPRNAVRPEFYRMVRDLLRFNRELRGLLRGDDTGPSLGQLLEAGRYGRWFVERLIVPQVSAIWSADPADAWELPARFLATFFDNHGLLGFRDRPRWRTVVGGSRRYVERLIAPFQERIAVSTPVEAVTRHHDHVSVTPRGGEAIRFDEVVLACHADQARAILTNPTRLESELLGAFPYKTNDAVLHTDTRIMPRRRACWQAWNFHLLATPKPMTTITYGMNHLQSLDAPEQFLVTLNLTERIDPTKIVETFRYSHPTFTPTGVAAQARHAEISGVDRIHYAGAYWGWGFHEDGVVSGIEAVARRKLHTPEPASRV